MACQSTAVVGSRTSRIAAVICFASSVCLPSSLVTKDPMEVSPLAREASGLYPFALQNGLRLLHLPLPPRLSASLTGRFPSREACGLTTFRIGTSEWGRSRLFAGGRAVYGKE